MDTAHPRPDPRHRQLALVRGNLRTLAYLMIYDAE